MSLGDEGEDPFRWIFLSDVCKHCEEAGCLEACPTGSIVRTEVGSVLVQDDVCNGCGYCVVSCPFGVIDRRPAPLPDAGGAFKCTFCYDRQKSGLMPACAKVCPTESIVFGRLDDLRARGADRVKTLATERLHRRANVRSAGNLVARPPRVLPDPRRTRSLRPTAETADPDHLPEVGVDGRDRHRASRSIATVAPSSFLRCLTNMPGIRRIVSTACAAKAKHGIVRSRRRYIPEARSRAGRVTTASQS